MSVSNKLGDLASKVYENVLLEEVKKYPRPRHIGIITDGNRRYARNVGISENEGHVKGKEKVEEVVDWCMELDIRIVTFYAFSTENFRRSPEEVDFLFHLIDNAFKSLLKDERVYKNRINVRVIGNLSILPAYLRQTIHIVEETTKNFNNYQLNLAIGYGGREEILDAIKRITRDAMDGKLNIDELDEEKFRMYLYDGRIPDPDLILRTSGEERISNFLLWQSAYSELYFSDVYWPEFSKLDFLRAIYSYQRRQRRFGR
ncbi:MAG: polyprenyl diphosphate synthase [Thermoplasma acidophilum]|nr:polyprenyl diphosphate synthase [Thermoplasma acidophilum]